VPWEAVLFSQADALRCRPPPTGHRPLFPIHFDGLEHLGVVLRVWFPGILSTGPAGVDRMIGMDICRQKGSRISRAACVVAFLCAGVVACWGTPAFGVITAYFQKHVRINRDPLKQ
jgi:hypothetical protein